MGQLSNVWIFAENQEGISELVSGAAQLGQRISAFSFGSAPDQLFALGISEVLCLGDRPANRMVEDYAETLAQKLATASEPTLLILPATRRSKALAARLGVLLNAGVVNEAVAVSLEDGKVHASHRVYGGLAIQTVALTSKVAIVTVASGAFAQTAATPVAGQSSELAFVEPQNSIRCVEVRVKEGASVNLDKAARVIGIGRGIAQQSDIKMVEELGAAWGAELGCTRPIAEGEKWMDRARYIGVSGVMLKPEVYVALGVSGQIQHMVGVTSSQTIIAINKDKNAPVFQFADYGLVGDINKVVPKLIEAFKA